MLKGENIDVIISSPMNRCLDTIRETAKFHNIEVIIDERLTEMNPGELDGQALSKDPIAWNDTIGKTGESCHEVYEKMKSFLKEIQNKYSGKTIALVSHGHPIWLAKKVLKDFDYDDKQQAYKVYPGQE
jgi:broad specificity phosphatase PhoE